MHLYSEESSSEAVAPERSFLKLVDGALDCLAQFTSHSEENTDTSNCPKTPKEVLPLSQKLRANIDLILGQSLGFANVALSQDKRALSALCQKVGVHLLQYPLIYSPHLCSRSSGSAMPFRRSARSHSVPTTCPPLSCGP